MYTNTRKSSDCEIFVRGLYFYVVAKDLIIRRPLSGTIYDARGMSAVVAESLQHTSWAGPLQMLARAPGPNASAPEQPKRPGQGLRPPPRLPEPPPVLGGAGFGGEAFGGEALASAAVEGVAKLFGSGTDSPRRELLLSRPHPLPLRALRRVRRQSARGLLHYQNGIESSGIESNASGSNDAAPEMHTWKHIHDSANATRSSTWYHDLTPGLHGIDSMHVALAVTVVVLLFILAVGVLRGWWRREEPNANAAREEYPELTTAKASIKCNYDI